MDYREAIVSHQHHFEPKQLDSGAWVVWCPGCRQYLAKPITEETES